MYAAAHYTTTLLEFELRQPLATPSVTSEPLTLFYANTNLYNQDVSGVRSIVTERKPDTVVIVEASEDWIVRSGLRETYPFRHEILNRGVWGIALFSRFPLSEIREDLGEDVPPVIIAQMEVSSDYRVPIAAVHLPPPVSQDAWTMARYGARRLSTELRHASEPWIIVGDFNSGPYGRVYESFQNAARVQNAAIGFGLFQTWNAQSQILRATIDHIFVKENVLVTNFETVKVAGSDHKGLWMNYSVAVRANSSMRAPQP